MKINLKNVKQHKSFYMELPDKGMVLLRGRSGAGKSSILSSIVESLYSSVGNLTHWDESKSSIELDFLGLNIVKTHGPKSLKVKDDGRDFTDEEAQGVLNKRLGMSEKEFMASSYVEQDAKNSLLTLGPAEQLRFIQRLAFGDQDPESIKIKIKKSIDETSALLRKQEEIVESKDSRVSMLLGKCGTLESSLPPKTDLPYSKEEYQKKLAEISSLRSKETSLSTKLQALNSELTNPIRKEVEGFATVKSEVETKIAELNKMIKSKHEELIALGDYSESKLMHLRGQLDTLSKHKKFLEWSDKAKSVKTKILQVFPQYETEKSLSDALSVGKERVSQKLSETLAAIKSAEAELSNLDHRQDCPKCNSPLKVVSGKIQDFGCETSSPEMILANIESLNKSKKDLKSQVDNHDALLRELDLLRASKPENPDVSEIVGSYSVDEAQDLISQEIEEVSKKISTAREIETVIRVHAEDSAKLGEKLKSLSKKLDETKAKLRTEESIRADQDTVQKEMSLISEKIESLSQETKGWPEANERKMSYESHLARLEEAKAEHLVANAELIESRKELERLKDDYASFTTLRELSDRAALEALEEIINSINFNAKYYIDQMFPNDGTVAALSNKKTLGTGEERAKLSLRLFHKGCEVKNYKELSGGEKARLTLAFQLAMSDLYQSPILMLDEPFSGLDAETMALCLEALKEAASRKLILMIEHGAPEGFFDEIKDL